MGRKREKTLKIIMIVLSILLALSIVMLGVILFYRSKAAPISDSAAVTNNIITPDEGTSVVPASVVSPSEPANNSADNAETINRAESTNNVNSANDTNSISGVNADKLPQINLYKRHAEDNEAFQVANMFPGDVETKYFCVKVSYKDDVIVRYHADIRSGGEKLAEVLRCRVVLLSTGETLYDGLMRDMPDSLEHRLATNSSTSTQLYYEITAYLDTSVGNEYMNRNLAADFRWWVEEKENLDSVKTGDTTMVWLWIGLAAAAVLVLVLLWVKRRREVQDESGK